MSLRKKIIFSFFISATIIAILVVFQSLNFIQVRDEMRFLEVTDSARNRSLQLRRHEKNYFLFPERASEESQAVRDYLDQLDGIAAEIEPSDPEKAASLWSLVSKYREEFLAVEGNLKEVYRGFEEMRSFAPSPSLFSLIELDARDKPLYVALYLQEAAGLAPDDAQVIRLQALDSEVNRLRETGEDITVAANELDRDARDKAERGISLSQTAILAFFPLFLLLGLGALLYISTGTVRRLKTLTDAVERISHRYAPGPVAPEEAAGHKDEVDTLVEKFNDMNTQLNNWEQELDEKNRELYESKKLAAIGTMASGVAHELNNPLNNISLSAQVLWRQLNQKEPPEVMEIVEDIVGQTARVKGIVGNLLEFAREREPELRDTELNGLVRRAYELVNNTMDTREISFSMDSPPEGMSLRADPGQLERVFVNLFSNAITAMDGKGRLAVRIRKEDGKAVILVSDTGKGIPKEDRDKIFDPFFTKKEKGTGLGLAIVMNIIRKHSGSISVISEEGMGTMFEINLPTGEF